MSDLPVTDADGIRKGDWVAFVQGGGLVIGQVEYIPKRESWERYNRLITTVGTVSEEYVLEVRTPNSGESYSDGNEKND